MAITRAGAVERATKVETSLWRDYLTLTKPEITFLVAISALAGFLLGSENTFDGWTLFFLLNGVILASAGGATLNHFLERTLDASMRRTQNRPLPAGRISPQAACAFGCILVMAGIGTLCPLVNPLTGVLATLTVILYLFVYTPLKRKTTLNTLVGTIPGALPALGGWTAATGELGWGGWAIFLILLTWQMPHFLSLAWMYRKDYSRAKFQMLPVVSPDGATTALQVLLFTILLLFASLTPSLFGVTGLLYIIGALILGIGFLFVSLGFFRQRSHLSARRVLKASIYYIPLLVLLIFVDFML